MSLKSQIEEITGQLAAAQAQIAEEQAKSESLAAQIAELEGQHTAAIEAHAQEIAALTEERDAHLNHTHEQAARIAAIEADLAQANDELAQARQALSNPAFLAAATAGGEAVQDVDGHQGPALSALAQFEAIVDPQEKRAFYKANREAIKAELEA